MVKELKETKRLMKKGLPYQSLKWAKQEQKKANQ